MKKCFIVGLTGQSGAGKTTVSNYFQTNGYTVINCDIVSRKVTEPNSECNKKLAQIFPDCFDENFSLDRKKMAREVFSDENKLKLLNGTIFPFIIEYINNEISELNRRGVRFILLDAPTLFEAEMENICDFVVSVVADYEIRKERIAKRDGVSEQMIEKRFASQKNDEFFRRNSDFIIENNSDETAVLGETINVIERIKEIADEAKQE